MSTLEQPLLPETRTRAEINRANAQKSTGPRTPEGKAKSRLNSTTHGLTAHVNALVGEETPEDFLTFRQRMFHDLAPSGPEETSLAEALVAQHWRLQRIPAVEVHILTLSRDAAKELALLGLYEQRLLRQIQQTRAALVQLQAARRAADHEQMVQAAALRKLHKDHNRPFHPADFGFVFSLAEIDRYTARCADLGAAKIHAKNTAQAFLNPEYRPNSVFLPAKAAA
jgi:hypothetical protein